MSKRHNYTIALEVTPIQGLSHGAGNEGNEQILMTRGYRVPVREAMGEDYSSWERIEVPAVSGAALKATLREWAVAYALGMVGIGDEQLPKDVHRLLLKGGKNTASGKHSVSLAEARKLRELFPLLSVFGSMDKGFPMRGQIQCSDVLVYARELVDAGLIPTHVSALQVSVGDEVITSQEKIPIYPGIPPIPTHLSRERETNYRHDSRTSPLYSLMKTEDRNAIEDRSEAVASAKKTLAKPKKDERREANESMPYSAQVIAGGTPMLATIRLRAATDVEFAVLATALGSWVASGGHLGGRSGSGNGACRVVIRGGLRYSPDGGLPAQDGSVVKFGESASSTLTGVYQAHVADRRDEIISYLTGGA